MGIKIGNSEIKHGLFLAPMAGVTDLAFRIICDRFGAGLSYTEMVSAKALSFSDKKTNTLMQTMNLPLQGTRIGSSRTSAVPGIRWRWAWEKIHCR